MRPEHLPEYTNPPLDEVVVGVQFRAIPGYTVLASKEVWEIYKDSYPTVHERPYIEPTFETFGGINPQQGSVQFQFGEPSLHNRLWFISDDEDHLLQFQEDRLLLNWRKRREDQAYPRFEGIKEAFEDNLRSLEKHFDSALDEGLDINQAEVTYINFIPVQSYSELGQWVSMSPTADGAIEEFSLVFNEVVSDESDNPFARLNHEIQSVRSNDKKTKAIKIALTFRGQPQGNTIEDALGFIEEGRERIVSRFTELTTEMAHKTWERTK